MNENIEFENETVEITLKEVYERIVALEAKYDVSLQGDDSRTKKFTYYVYLLAILVILDIALTLFSLLLLM